MLEWETKRDSKISKFRYVWCWELLLIDEKFLCKLKFNWIWFDMEDWENVNKNCDTWRCNLESSTAALTVKSKR